MKSSEAAARAAAYLSRRGSDLTRARAGALLGRVDPALVVARLDPDPGDPRSLRAALEACDDLRALADPRVEAWVGALVEGQAPDGGFASDLPPEARLFETGMIAGHIAKTRYARPEVLRAAGDFLARHWDPALVRGGSWNAIAAYAHFFASSDHDEADGVLQWCGRELARGFVTRAFDAVRTARVLVYCDAHGLPGAELRAEDLVIALVTEQERDGSFPAWEGEGARDAVGSTLDALVALRRLA
jgi:hypothetical protein